MIKEAYHPTGLKITFCEDNHTYIDDYSRVYESGTTFCGRFFEKFDMDAMSKKCSEGSNPKYSGRDPEDIKAEWQSEGDRGRNEGTNIHAYAESSFDCIAKIDVPAPISDRCEKIFKQVDIAVSKLLKNYLFIAAEMIIFSPSILKSGTIDLLMFDPFTNTVLILDWKQNKEIKTENFWQSAVAPFEYLQDTDINHYALQLSFYQYILETNNYLGKGKPIKFKRAIIHLFEHGFKPYWLEDLTFEIKQKLSMEA